MREYKCDCIAVQRIKRPSTQEFVKAAVGSARYELGANPSIEGTCNIWLRQLSPAPHVKR